MRSFMHRHGMEVGVNLLYCRLFPVKSAAYNESIIRVMEKKFASSLFRLIFIQVYKKNHNFREFKNPSVASANTEIAVAFKNLIKNIKYI